MTSGTVVAPMSTHCFLHGTLAGHNRTGRFYSIRTSYSSTVETENEVRLSSEKLVDRSGVGMGAGNVLPIYIFVTEKKKQKRERVTTRPYQYMSKHPLTSRQLCVVWCTPVFASLIKRQNLGFGFLYLSLRPGPVCVW